MVFKKLYLHGLTEAQMLAVSAQLALSSVGVTKADKHHAIVSTQHLDVLEEVVERCQKVVGRPLEVGMGHQHGGISR